MGIYPVTEEQIKRQFPERRKDKPTKRYLNQDCWTFTNKTIPKYLEQQGFVQQHNGLYRDKHIIINEKTGTIRHTTSKQETRITGEIQDYIDYFKRL